MCKILNTIIVITIAQIALVQIDLKYHQVFVQLLVIEILLAGFISDNKAIPSSIA